MAGRQRRRGHRGGGAEAATYANGLDDVQFTGLSQAFQMFDPPGPGVEVFSLMRTSDLDTASYLSRFFDTGRESQQHDL